jgi:hypothetical protein
MDLKLVSLGLSAAWGYTFPCMDAAKYHSNLSLCTVVWAVDSEINLLAFKRLNVHPHGWRPLAFDMPRYLFMSH